MGSAKHAGARETTVTALRYSWMSKGFSLSVNKSVRCLESRVASSAYYKRIQTYFLPESLVQEVMPTLSAAARPPDFDGEALY